MEKEPNSLCILVVACGLAYEQEDIRVSRDDVLSALQELGLKYWYILHGEKVEAQLKYFIDKIDIAFIIDPYYLDENRVVKDIRFALEENKIKYTGVSVQTAALCRDKYRCLELFRSHNVMVPLFKVLNPGALKEYGLEVCLEGMQFPFIVKPRYEGAGVGVYLCKTISELEEKINLLLHHYTAIQLEEYIEGREVTVGVISDGYDIISFPPVELELVRSKIYDYETKRCPESVNRYIPARLDKKVLDRIGEVARKIYRITGCSGLARIDFRVNKDIYAIEINSSPALGRDEHVARAAEKSGWHYRDLIGKLIETAL